MSDQVASLKLEILNTQALAASEGMSASLKRLDAQSVTTKGHVESVGGGTSTLTEKLQQLDSLGVPGVGRLAGAFEAADAAGTTFLGTTGLVVAGVAAVAAGAAAFYAKAVSAASEGEQAEIKLASALKAVGQYSDATAGQINSFAQELLATKGTSDELTTSLVAQGVTMGLTISQSERLVSTASDMQIRMGSVQAAFDALTGAASGNERAMMLLQKQFGFSAEKGLEFHEVLAKIESKVNGAAAAQIETFAGSWKLLKDNVGNMLEEAGGPMMTWLSKLTVSMNAAIKSRNDLAAAMRGDIGSASIAALVVQMKTLQEEITKLEVVDAGSDSTWMLEKRKRLAEIQDQIIALKKEDLPGHLGDIGAAGEKAGEKLSALEAAQKDADERWKKITDAVKGTTVAMANLSGKISDVSANKIRLDTTDAEANIYAATAGLGRLQAAADTLAGKKVDVTVTTTYVRRDQNGSAIPNEGTENSYGSWGG